MDNRIISQLLRGLKVTTGYILTLILFLIFTLPIITIAKDGMENALTIFSFLIFLFLFYTVYVEMRVIALKEKRPQYNINPPAYKGIFYGIIGIIPLTLFQVILLMLKVPEDFLTFKRRLYQGFGGPLYWFSKFLGDEPIHYIISFILIIIIAGLGYFAGYKDFYFLNFIRDKLGMKKKAKNKNVK